MRSFRKCVVIRRGVNVADENQSCVHCTGSSSFTPADSYSYAGVLTSMEGRSKAELLCSGGTVLLTLKLEQGRCSWTAEGLLSLLTLLKSVGLFFIFFALIHREEIKYSKTWLTVAELLQERARSTNRVRGDVTGCEGLWQDGVNNWRIWQRLIVYTCNILVLLTQNIFCLNISFQKSYFSSSKESLWSICSLP